MKKDSEITIGTLREILESLGAGEAADGAIFGYVLKRIKDAIESSSKEQAAAEFVKLINELKADRKSSEFVEIVNYIAIGVALRKN